MGYHSGPCIILQNWSGIVFFIKWSSYIILSVLYHSMLLRWILVFWFNLIKLGWVHRCTSSCQSLFTFPTCHLVSVLANISLHIFECPVYMLCSLITCLNFKENIYSLRSWRLFYFDKITVIYIYIYIYIYILASICLNCYFSLRKCKNYILKLILFRCSHIH